MSVVVAFHFCATMVPGLCPKIARGHAQQKTMYGHTVRHVLGNNSPCVGVTISWPTVSGGIGGGIDNRSLSLGTVHDTQGQLAYCITLHHVPRASMTEWVLHPHTPQRAARMVQQAPIIHCHFSEGAQRLSSQLADVVHIMIDQYAVECPPCRNEQPLPRHAGWLHNHGLVQHYGKWRDS